MVGALNPVRAARLAYTFSLDDDGKRKREEFEGKFKNQNEFSEALFSLCEISSRREKSEDLKWVKSHCSL